MLEHHDPYIIDFRNINHPLQVHEILKEALDFSDYYGKNWDAFWDCITDMAGKPVHIELYGLDVLEEKFPETAQVLLECLTDFKHYNNDKYIDDIRISIMDGEQKRML